MEGAAAIVLPCDVTKSLAPTMYKPTNSPDTKSGSDVEVLDIKLYFVACLDVLGQQAALLKFKGFPPPKDADVSQVINETFGVVRDLSGRFCVHIRKHNYEKKTSPRVPQAVESALRESLRHGIKVQACSDTILLYRSLNEPGVPAFAVSTALAACAEEFLRALAGRHALRGGITVGLAGEVANVGLYGPALHEAYYLESKIAKHPRIVISKSLADYLGAKSNVRGHRLDDEATRFFARQAAGLVKMERDGSLILDYLGPGFLQSVPNSDLKPTVARAYSFLLEERTRFAREGNAKLVDRYEAAIDYFRSSVRIEEQEKHE